MSDTANKKKNGTALGSEKIPRLVLRFSSATLAALLLNSVYTLTDALFVSWGVGTNAMGGVSVVFPFVVLQGAVASAVGSGAASIVSRKLGEGKNGEAGETTLNAMFVFYSTAILTSVLGLVLMNPLLNIMGVTAELFPFARQYFLILLAGNIFSTGFSNIIRAEGKMLYGLLIWVIPISINIALDALFILGFGWGVTGSALATVICQFVSFCMSVLFFTRFTTQSFSGVKIRLRQIFDIIAIGLPSLIQMGSLSIISALLNNLLGSAGGTLGVTVFAYINKIISFAVMPFTAFTQALAPIVGYNFGVGSAERVKKTIRFCLLLSFIYAIAALVAIQLFSQKLIGAFTNDTEIINLGAGALKTISFALIFMPLPMLAGASFQAMGEKLRALIMYAATLIFMVPAAFILSTKAGINGIWQAYTAASAAAAALAIIITCPRLKRLNVEVH